MFKKFPELIENAETISYIGKIENIVGYKTLKPSKKADL